MNVKFPAVIQAAQAILPHCVRKRARRIGGDKTWLDQPDLAVRVAKSDQVFPQQADAPRRTILFRQVGGLQKMESNIGAINCPSPCPAQRDLTFRYRIWQP